MSKQSSFLFQRALLSAESDFSVQLMIERHTGQAVFLQVAAFARLLRVMRGGGGTGQLVRGIRLEHITESADTLYVSHKVIKIIGVVAMHHPVDMHAVKCHIAQKFQRVNRQLVPIAGF